MAVSGRSGPGFSKSVSRVSSKCGKLIVPALSIVPVTVPGFMRMKPCTVPTVRNSAPAAQTSVRSPVGGLQVGHAGGWQSASVVQDCEVVKLQYRVPNRVAHASRLTENVPLASSNSTGIWTPLATGTGKSSPRLGLTFTNWEIVHVPDVAPASGTPTPSDARRKAATIRMASPLLI